MKYIQSFEVVNEAKRGVIHKAAKQGSYPAVVVVVQDGKVIHQEPVSTPDIAPATFNVMQEKYPKALLHLEDKTGKRLFSESVVTEAEDYKYKKYVTQAFDKISDAMFAFRNAMGVKQLGQADSKLKKRIEAMQTEIFALRRDMKSEGLTESVITEGEDTIGGLNKMANTDLERIADYADMIKDRMSQGQTLDAWMYSKISDSVKNLNSVHDTMDGNDGVDEAFIGPFVFNDRMSDEELKAMYNGALDGYANYSKGFQHSKSDYKQAYQEIEKILKKRGVSVDESVITEAMDLNDPVLVAFRRTRAIMELPKFKSAEVKSRRISFNKYMDLLDSQTDINVDIANYVDIMAQTLRDMEQEAEPEGGAIADKYGSIMMKQEKEYAQLKAKKAKIDARIEKYKMS